MSSHEKRQGVFKRQLIMTAVLLVLAGLLVTCSSSFEEAGLARLHFRNPDGKDTPVFKLEIASTTPERTKGLMYRDKLARDRGMVFIFPEERVQSFWMKNTFISLDMLFLNTKLEVVGLLENVPIMNEEPRQVSRPSLYVIELAAGVAREHGIKTGSVAVFESELPRGVS